MHRNKQRKGISTIIAALFTVAVIIVGINVMMYGSSLQNNFAQTEVQKNQKATERLSEQLQLTGLTIKNNQFNITLYNTGSLPVHLVGMWVTNNTATNWHRSWDLTSNNYILNPRNATRNIGQSLTPTLQYCLSVTCPTTKPTYTFGFVTERGTIATYKLAGGSDAMLNVQMFATPLDPQTGNNIKVFMLVRNNNTLADAVTNIVPNITTNPSNACTTLTAPTPSSEPSLIKGSSTSFQWTCTVQGTIGQTVTFTGSINNGMSNQASASVTLTSLSLTQTNFASIAGTLTIDYNTIQHAQHGEYSWKYGFTLNASSATVFRATMTNHDPTNTFYLSKSSALVQYSEGGSSNVAKWVVTDSATPSNTGGDPSVTSYCAGPGDYCSSIAPNGGTLLITFGATAASGSTVASTSTLQSGKLSMIPMLVLGKMCVAGSSGCPSQSAVGLLYGQNIPFIASQVA